MQATVFINGQWGDWTAQGFCEALLAEGHGLAAVVFYHDASRCLAPEVDLDQRGQRWCQLSLKHRFPLLVCAAAASRRGIHADPVASLSFGRFLPVGLATILDAVENGDRTLTFSA